LFPAFPTNFSKPACTLSGTFLLLLRRAQP